MKRTLKKENQELLRLDSPEIELNDNISGYYWTAQENNEIHNGFFKTEQEAIEWADKYCEPLEDLERCIDRMSNDYKNHLRTDHRYSFYGYINEVYKGDWKEEIKQAVLNSK